MMKIITSCMYGSTRISNGPIAKEMLEAAVGIVSM